MLKQSGALKPYDKAKKLYVQYEKDKARGRPTDKMMPKLTETLKDAEESVGRITQVYTKASEAMQKEEVQAMVQEHDYIAYLAKLKEYCNNIKAMTEEVNSNVTQKPIENGQVEKKGWLSKKEKPDKTESSGKRGHATSKLSIEEIVESASAQIEKIRKDGKGVLTKQGVEKRVNLVRAETRVKLKEAGYSDKDVEEYMNN